MSTPFTTPEEFKRYIETVGLGAPTDVRRFCCPECFSSYTIVYYIINPIEDLDCGSCHWTGFFSRASNALLDSKRRKLNDGFPQHELFIASNINELETKAI